MKWNETRRTGAILACFYVARVWQRQLGFLVNNNCASFNEKREIYSVCHCLSNTVTSEPTYHDNDNCWSCMSHITQSCQMISVALSEVIGLMTMTAMISRFQRHLGLTIVWPSFHEVDRLLHISLLRDLDLLMFRDRQDKTTSQSALNSVAELQASWNGETGGLKRNISSSCGKLHVTGILLDYWKTARWCSFSCSFRHIMELKTAKRQVWMHCMLYLYCFYPRDAMLARVIAIATCPSVRPAVCLSVCPSVTRRYCVKTKKASGMISSPSGSPKTLIFWRQISSPNSKG